MLSKQQSGFKSLPQVARVEQNERHQSSAGAHHRHVIFLDNSSSAVSMTGSFEELSHVGKSMELLLPHLEPKRPVHEAEIQVIQFPFTRCFS